jgi:hypothetical protein
MLASLIKSVLPHRFLFPQRRQFRDRPAVQDKSAVPIVRLLGFFLGGLLLANLVLAVSGAFRAPAAEPALHAVVIAKRDPAAATPAAEDESVAAATKERAATEPHAQSPAQRLPDPIAARIGRDCAEHAREKLMEGLTHYYLQRRLRPGAGSEDVASTSNLTGLLAGPGDPASTTPAASCAG